MIVEEDLVARFPITVIVVEALDADHRFANALRGERGHLGSIGNQRGAHQNTSAGSALITRPTAIAAEIRHMPKVSPRLTNTISAVMCMGSNAT